jgi:tRNA pseudouridine38-40 synthase
VDSVADVLASKDRTRAGVTAPAQGLTLEEVIFDDRLPPRPQDDSDLDAAGP